MSKVFLLCRATRAFITMNSHEETCTVCVEASGEFFPSCSICTLICLKRRSGRRWESVLHMFICLFNESTASCFPMKHLKTSQTFYRETRMTHSFFVSCLFLNRQTFLLLLFVVFILFHRRIVLRYLQTLTTHTLHCVIN